MKMLVTKLAIATSIALATLAATEAAYAQSYRHHADHRALQSRPPRCPTMAVRGIMKATTNSTLIAVIPRRRLTPAAREVGIARTGVLSRWFST
jgi:hypothetical protein